MGDRKREEWRRSRRAKWIAGQLALTVLVVIAVLWAPLSRAMPVGAAGGTAQKPVVSGISGGVSAVLAPAPAGYRDQLQNYFTSLLRSAQRNASQPGTQMLVSYTQVSQKLVASANDKDLSIMYYETSKLPSFRSVLTKYAAGTAYYRQATHYLDRRAAIRRAGLQDKSRLRPLDFASSTNCPAPGDTAAVQVGLTIAWVIAFGIYQLFSASFFIEALGEGTTIPVSPIRLIAFILSIPLELAMQGASDANEVRLDCIENTHRTQMTSFDQYLHNLTSVSQVDIHVTPIDAYHFVISTHEFGKPININTTTLQIQSFQGSTTNGQTVTNIISHGTSSALTGVVWKQVAGTDPGLYTLTVPPNYAGSSYRISVDNNGATCTNFLSIGDNCVHYGSTVFTRLTNS